ncbi:MAG: alanine racemase [Candidatus Euphemobacter frigidus]|nr:alanine racemase [Candidatus Euphemobacter frigidus]MDP8275771.1 alanine racemase [Candidatus Euphemobacter frigidus]
MQSDTLFKTWAEIDLEAIRYNIGQIRKLIGDRVKILVSVKADAYGHGVVAVSRTALAAGAEWLGVSHVKEALELRAFFPKVPILILSSGMRGHSRHIIRNNLTPMVCSVEIARDLARTALEFGTRTDIHIMLDTGMGRIGVWHENCLPFLEEVSRIQGIRIEGLASHFAAADDPDNSFTLHQLQCFLKVVEDARKQGIDIPIKHIANSGALLGMKESRLDMVRPGIMLYGVYPAPHYRKIIELKPALSLKTRIAYLKTVGPGRTISYGRTYTVKSKTRVATLPIGYGDGFSRAHSGRGEVLIRGKRAPIIGIVTMDQIMVDVGKIDGVSVEDEAVLIGEQGGDRITAEEVAGRIGTISYEVLSQLGKRVSRVYL